VVAPARGLQVVPGRVVVRRGSGFIVVLAMLLVSGLVGLLLLNLSMQKGAFELAGLQAQTSELQVQEQALDQQLERLESTQNLARRATRQGMVPSTGPVFLDLSDNSIIGDPIPAVPGLPLPGLQPRAPRPPAADPDTGSDTPSRRTLQQPDTGQTESPARRRGQ